MGEFYLVPSPVEEFLSFVYGPDWMTPKMTSNKEEYLSDDHFNTTIYQKHIRKKINNLKKLLKLYI